jgi:DNA-binding MarR family transcriptional regulator
MEKIQATPKTKSICNCINMRRAANAVTDYYDRILKPSGLTVSQFTLLKNINWLGHPCSVSELADCSNLERTTVARNLKPLFNAGLIEDISKPNGRTRQLRVTTAGLEALETALPLWRIAQQGFKENIGTENLNIFNNLIYKLENI